MIQSKTANFAFYIQVDFSFTGSKNETMGQDHIEKTFKHEKNRCYADDRNYQVFEYISAFFLPQ